MKKWKVVFLVNMDHVQNMHSFSIIFSNTESIYITGRLDDIVAA